MLLHKHTGTQLFFIDGREAMVIELKIAAWLKVEGWNLEHEVEKL
jgi:hypothetical protein